MYDPIEITKLYLFGTNNPSPSDYNQHIRPSGAIPASIVYDMNQYMTTGGGRFAYPSLFRIVERFFFSLGPIPDGSYTYEQLASILGLSEQERQDFLIADVSQYSTGIGTADHAERSYIFGSTSFEIDRNSVRFKVSNGVTRTIENLEVKARPDNFDFQSLPGSLFQYINDWVLRPKIDPYQLGRGEVSILFSGSGKVYNTYTAEQFFNDSVLESNVNGDRSAGILSLVQNGGLNYFNRIFDDMFLAYRTINYDQVIYGTPANDILKPPPGQDDGVTDSSLESFKQYLIAGGDGNDQIFGGKSIDRLFGGNGDDTLNGNAGDDKLFGGDGNDILNGGFGNNEFEGGKGDDIINGGAIIEGIYLGKDTAFYDGSSEEHSIEFLSDGKVKITDKIANRNGIDTLSAVKYALFNNKQIDLSAGQDISFVIDTTGSMGDDLAAIKAQSFSIINAIFDGSGYLNSRVSVVGYNDPYTETFLSFTDQPKIEDRKQAAFEAINRLYASGGGDFPESVNAGLIRALSGGAGQWRKDAVARRIILFGDAPPNDTQLRAQVLSLAANIGGDAPAAPIARMSIAGDIGTSSVSDGLALTRFSITAAEVGGSSVTYPVEIFTVLIGDDSTTRNDFTSLASATGGKIFTAANASEVVQTLISVIQTPITTDNSGNNTITGDDRDNTLDGGAGNDTISGLGGNDILIGGTGIDTMIGGTGNDTYFVDESGDVVTEDSTVVTEIDTVKSTITYSLGANVENLILTGTTAINGIGNTGDNSITGNNANNTLNGEGGNDTLEGNEGIDTLIGGAGDDTYIVDTTTDIITEVANNGNDTIKSSVTFSLAALTNIENLTLTGNIAINGTGNTGDNIITGNSANNTLNGESGNDILDGNEGIDTLIGGIGNDTYLVDTTTDIITEVANQGNDTIKSSVTFSLTALANIENLTLIGTAAVNGRGNAGDNVITGNNADNTLNGDAGNDTLYGGAGNDTLDGGLGKNILKGGMDNDIYIVDNKYDVVIEEVNEGIDTVRASFSYTLGTNLENLVLTDTGNNHGTGNSLDNTITGNIRNDELEGEDGNDILNGSAGNDKLDGGNGNDILDGGLDNDKLDGGNGNDILNGGVGNDKLDGGNGNDILEGGAGNDDLDGGDGNDTYVFDSNLDQGNDKIQELNRGGNDTIEFRGNESIEIDLSSTKSQYVNRNLVLKIQGIENITGGGGNDTISGDDLANILKGGAGNDIITAGDGNDEILGGLGNDRIDGGAGNDIIDAVTSFALVLPVISLGSPIENPGQNSIDIIKGGTGRDIFVLGSASNINAGISGSSYYVGAKNADYALIQDFEFNRGTNRSFVPGDLIQLYGRANDYVLGATSAGSPKGIGIFTNDINRDLIGIVQSQDVNLSGLNLTNNSQFSFVI
jgi:Ca2+-binding RTX toxin-like protein